MESSWILVEMFEASTDNELSYNHGVKELCPICYRLWEDWKEDECWDE